jgi:hypothetical protein
MDDAGQLPGWAVWIAWFLAAAANAAVVWAAIRPLEKLAKTAEENGQAIKEIAATNKQTSQMQIRTATAIEDAVGALVSRLPQKEEAEFSRSWRAKIAFDSFEEWADRSQFRTGRLNPEAQGLAYEHWLLQAMIRLETVLTESHRTGTDEIWEPRVLEELQKHDLSHDRQTSLIEASDSGRLRELLRKASDEAPLP